MTDDVMDDITGDVTDDVMDGVHRHLDELPHLTARTEQPPRNDAAKPSHYYVQMLVTVTTNLTQDRLNQFSKRERRKVIHTQTGRT